MFTIFRHAFAKYRGAILGWGLGLGVMGMYLVRIYGSFTGSSMDGMMQYIESLPKELTAFFGDITDAFTPHGFIDIEFFSYMPIILGIWGIQAGARMLAGDEESGMLDLVLAYPISRWNQFIGRLLAYVSALVGILLISWLGFAYSLPDSEMNITLWEVILPFLSLGSVLFLFGSIALFLSQIFPSRKGAAMVTGLILVASFFISALSRLDENLEMIAKFSPLNYYQGGKAMLDFNYQWFLGTIAVSIVLVGISWLVFQKRDIRVGGEGSWIMPFKKIKPI